MKTHLPGPFLQRMEKLLGNEYESFAGCYDRPAFTGINANTLKIEPETLASLLGEELCAVPWCQEGFYTDAASGFRPGKSIFYTAGLYYVQEPSAMCAAAALDVSPGHRVLDLCAAPGGKSVQLAGKLKGRGVLVSNDISPSRCQALCKNLEAAGVTNAVVTCDSPEKLAGVFAGYFDRILVDAPCSGEGMFRKDPESVRDWNEEKPAFYGSMQKNILTAAAELLAPGGRMLYSTCTFAPEENEQVITYLLNSRDDFDLLPLSGSGFMPGRAEWADGMAAVEGCARLWPHFVRGEGHFMALLQKRTTENSIDEKLFPNHVIGDPRLSAFHAFVEQNLQAGFPEDLQRYTLQFHEHSLFAIPKGFPALPKIRLLRSGFHLGDVHNNRFEPSQALAMGLRMKEARRAVNFSSITDADQLTRYVRGETILQEAADGWNLICVDGFPLGWGKAQDGRIKNKYRGRK